MSVAQTITIAANTNNVQTETLDKIDESSVDGKSTPEEFVASLPTAANLNIDDSDDDGRLLVRPPIDYSSVGAFFHSSWRRFKSLWTRRFVLSLLAGQVVSLCITCTNVTTEELTTGNWQLPTTQSFFLYLFLFYLFCYPNSHSDKVL